MSRLRILHERVVHFVGIKTETNKKAAEKLSIIG